MGNIVSLSKARLARQNKAKAPQSDHLSFITKRKPGGGGGFNHWDVKPTGDYAADFATGMALADEYLAFIGAWPTCGNATLLACIVRDMVGRGNWSGVHCGFMQGVNTYAMATASALDQR